MSCRNKNCQKPQKSKRGAKAVSVTSLLLIAILPKCPFCVMAYSGAVSLCSGKMFFPNGSSYAIYIFSVLCFLVVGSILLNFRDRRTFLSLALAIVGSFLVLGSQYFLWNSTSFYSGVMLLLFATWHNGSFYSVIKNLYINKSINQVNRIK